MWISVVCLAAVSTTALCFPVMFRTCPCGFMNEWSPSLVRPYWNDYRSYQPMPILVPLRSFNPPPTFPTKFTIRLLPNISKNSTLTLRGPTIESHPESLQVELSHDKSHAKNEVSKETVAESEVQYQMQDKEKREEKQEQEQSLAQEEDQQLQQSGINTPETRSTAETQEENETQAETATTTPESSNLEEETTNNESNNVTEGIMEDPQETEVIEKEVKIVSELKPTTSYIQPEKVATIETIITSGISGTSQNTEKPKEVQQSKVNSDEIHNISENLV